MAARIAGRSNEAWIAALQGRGQDSARVVDELSAFLRRVVFKGARGQLDPSEITEVVHESIGRVLRVLPSFRADSTFTTWAAAVALRVTFTELRRRYARQQMLDGVEVIEAEVRRRSSMEAPPPDEAMHQLALRQALKHAIASRLTERQRVAIVAELRGIPTVQLAEHLGISTNALYKLTHDARRKLRRALAEAGFGADPSRGAARGGSPCS